MPCSRQGCLDGRQGRKEISRKSFINFTSDREAGKNAIGRARSSIRWLTAFIQASIHNPFLLKLSMRIENVDKNQNVHDKEYTWDTRGKIGILYDYRIDSMRILWVD